MTVLHIWKKNFHYLQILSVLLSESKGAYFRLWCWVSSKFTYASLTMAHKHKGFSVYSFCSFGLIMHCWKLVLIVLLQSFGISPHGKHVGMQCSPMQIACSTHQSWALISTVGDVTLPPGPDHRKKNLHVDIFQFLQYRVHNSYQYRNEEKKCIVDFQLCCQTYCASWTLLHCFHNTWLALLIHTLC